MAGIQDFVASAAAKLGISPETAKSATGAVASLIQKAAGSADFAKIAASIPGLSGLVGSGGGASTGGGGGGGGGGLGGALGGLAQKAGGLLGGAGGASTAAAAAAVTGAGVPPDKAPGFLA